MRVRESLRHPRRIANCYFGSTKPVRCRKERPVLHSMPRGIHLIELVPQVVERNVPDGQRQKQRRELGLLVEKASQAPVEALTPHAGPSPLTERAEAGVAHPGCREVRLWRQIGVNDDVRLERQSAVGDLLANVPRICVEHQLTGDRGVVLAVSAELPEYAIIGVRGNRPYRGVAAPRHRALRKRLLPKVSPPLSIWQVGPKQGLSQGFRQKHPVADIYQLSRKGDPVLGLEALGDGEGSNPSLVVFG